ncbi:hypothetical protein HK102_005750, partial [Quaeritorhiza haematococci]
MPQAEQQWAVQKNLIRAFNTIVNDCAIEFIGTCTITDTAVPWLKDPAVRAAITKKRSVVVDRIKRTCPKRNGRVTVTPELKAMLK